MLPGSDWAPLKSELLRLKETGRPLRFVVNPGNAGDGLIASGTWQLFDELKLKPLVSTTDDIRPGDCAIYGGGGNLVPEYPACRRFLERCLDVGASHVLLLPHTIRGHEQLLGQLDQRFTLFCRESESLERVRASAPHARIMTAPDLALFLDVERLRRKCETLASKQRLAVDLVAGGQARRYLKWRYFLAKLKLGRSRTLRVLRADAEAPNGAKGDPRWDISKHYISKFLSRDECDFVSRDVIEFVRAVDEVVTNRLHIGIAGALVGKRVTFHDNSYGKIRAVYNSSLRGMPGLNLAE